MCFQGAIEHDIRSYVGVMFIMKSNGPVNVLFRCWGHQSTWLKYWSTIEQTQFETASWLKAPWCSYPDWSMIGTDRTWQDFRYFNKKKMYGILEM